MRQGFKQKNIVIIGAGFSGILTAQHLEKRTSRLKNISITLIDKNPYFTMRTEIHAAATGRGKPENITYNLAETFADSPNVSFFVDEVTDIDFSEKVVKGTVNQYSYDYLVIAAGSRPNFFGIPGAEENTLPFWTYEDALALKAKIKEQFQKAAAITNEEEQKKLLSFAVVGAGLTGVELAGELAEYLPLLCKEYALPQYLTSLYEVDALAKPIANFPDSVCRTCNNLLVQAGVKLVLNARVSGVNPGELVLNIDGKEERIEASTIVWTAGITAENVTEKAAETLQSEKGFRLVETGTLQSVSDPSVFVVGDNMYYIPKGKHSPAPQMVENTEQSSKVAAANIAELVTNRKARKIYKPAMHGAMISLGSKKAIAYAGIENLFMVRLHSPLAQLAKRAINVYFLVPVFGTKQFLPIAKHEFFAERTPD